ncbi:MAG: 4-hydroxy-tetrahydrodipicolinate synthase [Clostridia bacterium]|nr:4-hydroxy-tetrahydrodipicolinate synthase [Clostridia bacterium]
MNLFKGAGVALITPFSDDGSVDYASLEKLIEFQIKGGTDAIICLGTTGEPSTMTSAEKIEVMTFVKDKIAGRIPMIIGTGSNCTETAVQNSRLAEKIGADAILAVTPYYNKCTQQGLVEYYKDIHNATSLPVIAYNVPGRTSVNILPSTFKKMVENGSVVAIKEASGNMNQIVEVASIIKNELNGEALLYSGDDGLTLPVLAVGGAGIISVASNCVPEIISGITKAYFGGDMQKAQALQLGVNSLIKALFMEVNPTPVKKACNLLGLCKDILRKPLLSMEEKNVEVLKDALNDALKLKEIL